MRRCGFPERRGFTLLEMTLAIAASGMVVALLVAVWIQAVRAGERSALEAAEARSRADLLEVIRAVAEGAQWQSNSHLPQGTPRWEGGPGRALLWSRDCRGQGPGPSCWEFALRPGVGLDVQATDPGGAVLWRRQWPAVTGFSWAVCQDRMDTGGENFGWIPVGEWEPAVPFRPQAIAFQVALGSDGDRRIEFWF